MVLEIRNISSHKGIRYKPLKEICQKILSDMKMPNAEVSLLLVNDTYIKKINKKYLNRDRPTDVIAFSMLEGKEFNVSTPTKVLGDIIISVDTAKKQAREYKHSLNREIKILFIHGLFHLFGYDDTSEKSKKAMMRMEMKYR